MRVSIASLVLFTSLIGCGGDNKQPGVPFAFDVIKCPGIAGSSSWTTQEALIIDNEADYSSLFASADLNNNTEAPQVDFGSYSVAAINMGFQSSTGNYVVEVTSVYESQGDIFVEYTETFPPEGCVGDEAISYPYCFIKFQSYGFPIRFSKKTQTSCLTTF